MNYYLFQMPPVKLSRYLVLAEKDRVEWMKQLIQQPQLVEVMAYCLMPTHYHLMLRQLVDGGIVKYLSQIQNSYTNYFNAKTHRFGPVFSGRFKSVLVKSEEQLVHLSRYIHLNPYTAGIVKRRAGLLSYAWSSYPAYVTGVDAFSICQIDDIVGLVGRGSNYEKFVVEFADFERGYKLMKKVMLDAGI